MRLRAADPAVRQAGNKVKALVSLILTRLEIKRATGWPRWLSWNKDLIPGGLSEAHYSNRSCLPNWINKRFSINETSSLYRVGEVNWARFFETYLQRTESLSESYDSVRRSRDHEASLSQIHQRHETRQERENSRIQSSCSSSQWNSKKHYERSQTRDKPSSNENLCWAAMSNEQWIQWRSSCQGCHLDKKII